MMRGGAVSLLCKRTCAPRQHGWVQVQALKRAHR